MARTSKRQERVLTLVDSEREELERIARSRSAPHVLVRRAQIILASASGEANTSIARRLGVTNPTICRWRKRWFERGLPGSMAKRGLAARAPMTRTPSPIFFARC